jgi:CRISPR-associated endonuclease/helicase Cas3
VVAWLRTGPQLIDVPDPTDALCPGEEPAVLLRLLGPATASRASLPEDAPGPATGTGTPRVLLSHHQEAVRDRAVRIARALGLPDTLVTVVEDAARWHDLGKTEERFQLMLHGGDPHETLLAEAPVAKSDARDQDPRARRTALRLSGLPAGARHEAWSAALVGQIPYGQDLDLLIHLVASHHGHARPLLPPVVDHAPRPISAVLDGLPVTVSSQDTVCLDHPSRFARLNDRYGRWGLALLEAVVRCADATVSAEEP